MKKQVDLSPVWPANSGQCVNFYHFPEQGSFITQKDTSRDSCGVHINAKRYALYYHM
jgi:hypothetical protein